MILSASRRTDIPAFYSEWLFHRIREGFVLVPNPMNANQISRVSLSPDAVDCWVFWSKNPAPMLEGLRRFGMPWYLHYTLNAYGEDMEAALPPKGQRLDTFRALAALAGPGRVVWRYDPILLAGSYDTAFHIGAFGKLAAALEGCTDTCIMSFVDQYGKTARNTKDAPVRAPDAQETAELAGALSAIARNHGMALQTCAEGEDLSRHGIGHAACVDKARIERILGCALKLRHDDQRPHCGCYESIDIGMYHSCPNGCKYCYANANPALAARNAALHNPLSPLLIGDLRPEDMPKIRDRAMASCRAEPYAQTSFLE